MSQSQLCQLCQDVKMRMLRKQMVQVLLSTVGTVFQRL